MATTADDRPENGIEDTSFATALSERYLVYALSTITARSLPDLRDGLKPVHRRLLWAMRLLRLEPAQGYKKSARVVGDVIGKYHPHGDTSVYDAMVRLAQDFALRYPLVDGQGNFGNIDGDNAAAYRYTEAKLTAVAMDLMAGLDDGTVDFRPTYNGEEREPEVMPGLFPNLLANGASGIAVGMATTIPPHNAAEVLDAARILIDDPAADDAQLMAAVRGPDLPTGGWIVDGAEAIAHAYATGRGSFRVRSTWAVDRSTRGQWTVVVTEIPYGVTKGKLIEQIATVIVEKKLPILADVRDESAEDLRIVLEPRSRTVDADTLMAGLFRLTDLESRVSLNMNVLDAQRTPQVLSLREVLTHWLAHQIEVLQRRSRHRLAKIDERIELLDGYIVAYLNLDRVIAIIRAEDEPKPVLIAEFELTDRQAEAILNMRLRSLRKLEEMELRRERDLLEKERAGLVALLESPQRQRARLKKDIAALHKKYGPDTALGRRRTRIEEAPELVEVPIEAMIEREPVTVVLSKRGWLRGMKGHLTDEQVGALKHKEGDDLGFAPLRVQTTDRLLLVTDSGRFFTVGANGLPGGRGFGEPVRSMVDVDPDSQIVALIPYRKGGHALVASSDGRGFVAPLDEVIAETRKGKAVLTPRKGERLAIARVVNAQDDAVAVVGENRRLLVFALDELPEMVRGVGQMLQRYRDGGLADAITFPLAEGISWPMGGDTGRTRKESDMAEWRAVRGAAGRMPPRGFPASGRFSG